MKKTKSRFESTNFLTNVVTLIFIVIGVQGIEWTIDPGVAITEVLAANWEYIGNILLPALSGLTFKIIQKLQAKTWDWKAVLKSTNFWTQAITILAGLLAGIGFILPADTATEITNAIFSGSIGALVLAILANVITPLWQILFKPKPVPPNTLPKV